MATDVPDELFSSYPAKECRQRIAAGTNRGIGYTDAMIPDADYGLRPIAVVEGDGFRLRKAKTRGSMSTRVWVRVDVRPDDQGGSVLRLTTWRPRRLRVSLAVSLLVGGMTTVPLVIDLQSPVALAPAGVAALLAVVIFPIMRRMANQERRLLVQQLSRIVRARPPAEPSMSEARSAFEPPSDVRQGIPIPPRSGFQPPGYPSQGGYAGQGGYSAPGRYAGPSGYAPLPGTVVPPASVPPPDFVPSNPVPPVHVPRPIAAPRAVVSPRSPRALPSARALPPGPPQGPPPAQQPPAHALPTPQAPVPRQRPEGIPLISQELAERSGAPIPATLRARLPRESDAAGQSDPAFQVQVSGDPSDPPIQLLDTDTPTKVTVRRPRDPDVSADPVVGADAVVSADADTDARIPAVPALPAPGPVLPPPAAVAPAPVLPAPAPAPFPPAPSAPVPAPSAPVPAASTAAPALPAPRESVESAHAVVLDILELIPAGLDVGPAGGLADVTFEVTRADGVTYTTSVRISFWSIHNRKRVTVGARLRVRVDPRDQSRIALA